MVDPSVRARIGLAFTAIVCAFGVYRAYALRWVNDDAFISFRYAKNLIAGHGLVFNPGERVEGYTNFLWTMIVALGMRLGANPVVFTELVGIALFASLLAVWFAFHLHHAKREPEALPLFPVGAAVTAVTLHAQIYATSGLETMLYALLVSIGFVMVVCDESPRGQLVAGAALSLATMTRPDGALFYGAAFTASASLAIREKRLRSLVPLIAPALAIYLPYFLWRYSYYGYLFPNTFYAKIGGSGSLIARGIHYLRIFFEAYPVFAVFPLCLSLVWFTSVAKRLPSWLRAPDALTRRTAMFAATFLTAYVFFILRVGGDFMFGRFVVPIIAFFALSFELALRVVRPELLRQGIGLLLVPLLIVLGVNYSRGPSRFGQGVGEERAVYGRAELAEAEQKGATLRRYLAGTEAKVVFYGTQAMLAYYADFPFALEGYGLTDTTLAHMPIRKIGRAGHERQAPMDYLWKRGINFVFSSGLMKLPPTDEYKRVRLGGVEGQVIVYDRALMDRLSKLEGAQVVRFEEWLDRYIAEIPSKPKEKVAVDYVAFKHFYFDSNPDPERQKHFEAKP